MIIKTTSSSVLCDYCSLPIEEPYHIHWLLVHKQLHLHPECCSHLSNKLKRNYVYFLTQRAYNEGVQQCS